MEKLRCECLEACFTVKCAAAKMLAVQLLTTTTCSRSVFLIVTHERFLWLAPTPVTLKFLHVLVTLSSSLFLRLFFSRLSCCSHSSKLALLARSKNTSQKKPARCLYPFRIFLCLRHWGYVSIWLHPFLLCRLLNLWLCLAEGTQHVNVTKQPTRDCTGI